MILETNRLRLRELTWSDYEALRMILCDDEVMYAYNGAFSETEIKVWLERQLKRYMEYGFGLWAVIQKGSGEMIGQCGLTMQPWKERQLLEVGYLFRKDFWHQGFATEAARGCMSYAYDKLGADEIFSIIRDTNLPSRKVAIRNDMEIVDHWVKHYRGMDMPHLLYRGRRVDTSGLLRDQISL